MNRYQPSPDQAPHYEALFRAAAGSTGSLAGKDGVFFLRRSGLSDVTLRTVWQLADDQGIGHLTRSEFYVAMRLVAIAQAGYAVTGASLAASAHVALPLPRMDPGGPPSMLAPTPAAAPMMGSAAPTLAAAPPAAILTMPMPTSGGGDSDEFGSFTSVEAAPGDDDFGEFEAAPAAPQPPMPTMMDGGGGDSDLLGGVSSDAGSGSTAVAVDVAGEVPSKPGALGLMDQMMQASVSGVAGKSSAGPSLLSMRQQQQQSPAGEALPGKSMASGSTNAESLMEPEASSFDDWESVPTPMAPSSSSAVDKMAAIDALAEMDLAAENEDWEDFADSTTQVEPAPLEASTSIQQEAVASSSSSIGGGGGDLIITASAAASSGESGIFGDLTAALPQGDEPAILDIPPQSLPTAAEVGAPPSTGHETPQTQGGGQDDWTDFGMSAAAAHGDEPALDGVLPRPPVLAPPQPIQLGEDQEEEAGCEDDDWGDFEAHPTSSAEGAFPPPPPPADEDQSTEQQANDQGSGSANAAADDAPDDWGDFAAAGDGVSEGSKEGEDEPAAREEEEVPLDPFSALVSGGDEEKVPAVSVEPLPAAAGPNPDSCSLNELRDILVSKELLEEAKLVEEAVESESAGSLQVQKLTILSWRKAAASPASGTSVLLAMKTRLGAIDAAAADAFADAFIDGQESLCSHAARDFEGALCRLRGARRSATLFLILRQASHAKQTDLWRSCITIVHEHLSRLEEFANDLRAASPACVAEVRGQETSRAFVEAVGKMVALETEIRASALQARHTGLPAEFPAAKLHDLKEFLVDSAGFSWETLPLTSDANADPPLPEATCCVSWQRATDPLRHGAAVGSAFALNFALHFDLTLTPFPLGDYLS